VINSPLAYPSHCATASYGKKRVVKKSAPDIRAQRGLRIARVRPGCQRAIAAMLAAISASARSVQIMYHCIYIPFKTPMAEAQMKAGWDSALNRSHCPG
jgi:hypothetical protein